MSQERKDRWQKALNATTTRIHLTYDWFAQIKPQNPAPVPTPESKIPSKPPNPDCDKKLAALFGGPGAVAAGSGYEPSGMQGPQGGPSVSLTLTQRAFVRLILMSPTLLLNKGLNKTRYLPVVDEGSQGNSSGPGIFEEYDETKSLPQRLDRLDAFALYLNHTSLQGYVISYGGRRSCRGEALSRARFAKDYLSKVKSIDRKRITALDGGYWDNWAVQLWFGAQGESPPTPMPTVDRRKVHIIRNCKLKSSGRKKHGS